VGVNPKALATREARRREERNFVIFVDVQLK
jgi:hypothetical protein